MNDLSFETFLDNVGNFELRRVIERLREGLFDPLGVKLLTLDESKLVRIFDKGVKNLDKGNPFHLCICGAYGQGKSHSLHYIKRQAIKENFVASYVNLDPREVPFHDFESVYRALMETMEFPDGESSLVSVWKKRANDWLALPENNKKTCLDLIPEEIPHRFKAILVAIAKKNIFLPAKKRKLKKHSRFQPREFSWILQNALMGRNIPAWRLRSVFYYRQVSFYKEKSLACHGQDDYLDMIRGMAKLLRKIGFGGWVVLFDEGESITQTRITNRIKSYKILEKIFCPETKTKGFYPVFAFTDDFFNYLADEDYDRIRIKKNRSGPPAKIPYFEKNYSKSWKNINMYKVGDLSSKEWDTLINKLIMIHARAYNWDPPDNLKRKMEIGLSQYRGDETRIKIRFLINFLDFDHQSRVLKSL